MKNMMKRCLLAGLLALVSGSSMAQINGNELLRAADEIRDLIYHRAPYLTDSDKMAVAGHLADLKRILTNGSPSQEYTSVQSVSLMGSLDPQTVSVRLLQSMVVSSMQIRSSSRIRIIDAYTLSADGRAGLGLPNLIGLEILPFNPAFVPMNEPTPLGSIVLKIEAKTAGTTNLQVTLGSMQQPPSFILELIPNIPAGSFCMASCTSGNGVVDLRYVKGAFGQFEAQARESARRATQDAYSCSWSVKDVECSPQLREGQAVALAACTKGDGSVDLRYSKIDKGASLTEAKVKAANLVQSDFSCTWGLNIVSASAEVRPTYCTAACTQGSGAPDLRYSQGAQGMNEVEARGRALEAVQKAYSCTWGITIMDCSGR